MVTTITTPLTAAELRTIAAEYGIDTNPKMSKPTILAKIAKIDPNRVTRLTDWDNAHAELPVADTTEDYEVVDDAPEVPAEEIATEVLTKLTQTFVTPVDDDDATTPEAPAAEEV